MSGRRQRGSCKEKNYGAMTEEQTGGNDSAEQQLLETNNKRMLTTDVNIYFLKRKGEKKNSRLEDRN